MVISLASLAFQAAIEHAARQTFCCAYRPVVIIADLLETSDAIWMVSLWALRGLSIAALYPVVRIFVGMAVNRRADIGSMVIDCVFGVGAITGLYFAFVVAMGHSEPNWARGFRETWVALVVISGVALFLTRNLSEKTAVRGALWVGGVLIAALIPVLLISARTISDQGEVFHEDHATSTRYVFAVLITCLFWIGDICLSRPPAAKLAR